MPRSESPPSLFASIPDPFTASFDPETPWGLLGEPLASLLEELPDSAIEPGLTPEVHLLGTRIVIGRGTRIGPGAVIEGPIWIGKEVEIRPGAYLRGGSWIGDGAIVGANSEIKHSILLPGARAPHLNYVGDSILGAEVNLGAGTILSNFRHDGGKISIPSPRGTVATGRRKLGAILGDRVKTGCNCVLHPGVVVGAGSGLYPGVHLRAGFYPEETLIKLRQELILTPLR